jgi:DNA-binding NarL/FixJ family response regulator/class 3 adenylate cyclase
LQQSPLNTKPFSVLIADENGVFRRRLSTILSRAKDVTVLAEADNGLEAIDMALRVRPDVILLEMQLPGSGGIEALVRIKRDLPDVKALILLDSYRQEDIVKASLRGGHGFVSKGSSDIEMLQTVRSVAAGEIVLPASAAAQFGSECQRNTPAVRLSSREAETLGLLSENLTNREIADRLCISESTVRTHIYRLTEKLNLKSRRQAVTYASRRRWGFGLPKQEPSALNDETVAGGVQILTPIPTDGFAYTPPFEAPEGSRHHDGVPNAECRLATVLSLALEWSDNTSDASEADEADALLYDCLDAATNEIRVHGGIIAWFTAKGFTSLFGVLSGQEHAPGRALAAATALRKRIDHFSRRMKRPEMHLGCRIGINTGAILMKRDSRGSIERCLPQRDTVDLAVRVRDMVNLGEIAATDSTCGLTHDECAFERIGEVWMNGPVGVHLVLGASQNKRIRST